MTEKVETLHAAGFIMSEAAGNRSRDNATLASGENRGAGTVLGKTTTAGTITGAAKAGNTGNGTIGTLSVAGGAKVGVYKAHCIEPAADGGTFEVENPLGDIIGRAVVGSAFGGGEIVFTISDGGTDFAVGDTFLITVSQLTQKHKILAPSATDGTEVAAGVLLADVDASAADAKCVVFARDGEVNANELVWPGGITAAQKDVAIAQLQAAGVMVRS